MFIDYPIAVIGAGIIGASIAARLSSLGVPVVLIDRGAAGSLGASSYSGGLVRLYDSDPLLTELAAMSIGLVNQGPFADSYGPALQRTGAIYRAAPDQLQLMVSAIEQYACEGYPMRLLASHEPGYAPGRVNLFEPHACVGNVRQAVASLAALVRRQGLMLEHCELKALDCRSRHEVLLDIGQATLRCRAVVIAAGAWSQRWLPQLGLQTRSIPLARVHTPARWTMPVIDAVTQSYCIPLTSNLVQTGCGLRDTATRPQDLPLPDARHAQDACERLERLERLEQLGSAAGEHYDGQVSTPAAQHRKPDVCQVLDVLPGFDGYTPDGRPFLGFSSADSPVYLATGLSGLGFKLAPGLAEIAAEQLQHHLNDTEPGSGWEALSPSRLMSGPQRARAQP
jgi:glycine/D-amino acid oxidase-like deaminating enzyme